MKAKITSLLCALAILMALVPITSVIAEEPVTLTMFVDETWWPYEKWEGAIPEQFNLNANVRIEVTRAADANQLPLMVASGEMPDIVFLSLSVYGELDVLCLG